MSYQDYEDKYFSLSDDDKPKKVVLNLRKKKICELERMKLTIRERQRLRFMKKQQQRKEKRKNENILNIIENYF